MNKEILAYLKVTLCYWLFMLSDGALRMLVLFHFYNEGFSTIELASLFLLYEVAGVFCNALGGFLGTRFGLKITLVLGLVLQIISLITFSMLDMIDSNFVILFTMVMQAFAGIAKDLTKLSSKSAVKIQAKDSLLFKLVAILTGSKNSVKGIGFFLGGVLMQYFNFKTGMYFLALVILIALVISFTLENNKICKKAKLKQLFKTEKNIRILSLARIFLFGARDVWFVIGLPLYLSQVLQWQFSSTGTFLAIWVILYGIVQAITPSLLKKSKEKRQIILLGFLLSLCCILIGICLKRDFFIEESIVIGLALFGILFALNSSLHSYLIVKFSDRDKVAMQLGFYYMANAIGRLVGTILSGVLYHYYGIISCLLMAALFCFISSVISYKIEVKEDIS